MILCARADGFEVALASYGKLEDLLVKSGVGIPVGTGPVVEGSSPHPCQCSSTVVESLASQSQYSLPAIRPSLIQQMVLKEEGEYIPKRCGEFSFRYFVRYGPLGSSLKRALLSLNDMQTECQNGVEGISKLRRHFEPEGRLRADQRYREKNSRAQSLARKLECYMMKS